MDIYGWPVLFALVLWWASTILILVLNALPARTYRLSLGAFSLLAGVSMYGIWATSLNPSKAGVYCAFACGLTVWGWQIVTFYMGFITGPQRGTCPPDLPRWRRFIEAARTCIHHEFAILVMAAAIYVSVREGENQFGAWTFLVLWWMHLSAKLNLHFGVRNLGEQFLNPRMYYLVSYMSRRPMNCFFPLSVTASTMITVLLVSRAHQVGTSAHEAMGYMMLATLMALAILEHWFLVTPFDSEVLWKWGVQQVSPATESSGATAQQMKKNVYDRSWAGGHHG